MPVANSCCYMAEAITILQSNYPLLKISKLLFFKKTLGQLADLSEFQFFNL